ncbi:MAG: InlB B-repeat-containing protein, partial [Treponema sp.]|nr:InlB B-repeat-containing protein [Treponema sp.]
MKNIFIKVLPVLLISFYAVLLAIGCPSNSLEQSDTTSGVGTFSLKISGSEQQSRTIMPSDGTAQFGWYRIIFSRDGENVFDSVRPSNQFSAPVELPAGTDYTLKVFAYTIEPGKDTDLPAAYGESTNLSITAGQNVIEVIKLTAFGTTGADYGGMGIFSWSIGFTSDLYTSSILNLSEVKIGITPIAGTESPAYNYVLVAENPSVGQKRFTDTQTLGSGYYRVIIELNRANMHTVTWRETLHVYENMTSSYQNVFTNDHFLKNFYSVTFDAAGGSPSIPATSYFYDDSYEPSYPLRTGYSFDGWFKDGLGAAWNFSTQLTGDLDLVAKWTINKYTVTFDIGYDSGADPVSVTVDYGTKITKPQDPVRTKHEFMGWFKDAEYTEPWDFDDDTVPAQDISLHAKWEVIGLNVDRTSITLQQILGKDSLPGPQSIKITNTSSIPVTGITISISPANLFDLDNHTITTLAAEAEATFTVTPRNLGQGKHEATITINYTGAEELITIPVTFDVIPRFSGTAGANVSFNSNSLIVVPGALQGWYTRSISGTWLLNGRMASEGEDKVIDIPMSNVTITHSNFNNNNWNFIPGQGVANNGPGTTYGG